jgi:hypothetical protein
MRASTRTTSSSVGELVRAARLALCAALAVVVGLLMLPAPAGASDAQAQDDGWKVVGFRDARVEVPAAWPVHRLAGRPGCVRFDRPAVYVGDPSRSTCPPHLVGRTTAVHLTTGAGQGIVRPDRAVAAAGSAVTVVVSAGNRPGLARRVAGSVAYDDSTPRVLAGRRASEPRQPATTAGQRTTSATRTVAGATTFSGQGFDACTARSLTELATWYAASPYKAVNMYIGGASRGCEQPNLNAAWVSGAIAQGWVLIPTYVGLQAPCRNYPNVIDPAQAAAQGTASAADAVAQLNALGLGMGNPIYFDMEAFNYADTGCRQAVLDFLDAWTAELHVRGYVSGLYGSAESTIQAVVDQLANSAFDQPDQLWIARWCKDMAVCDSSTNDPVVPADRWADHQRIRQYRGGHLETWGGVTINIDSNTVDAAVSPSQLAADGSFVSVPGSGAVFRMVGGAPVYTSSWGSVGLPPQPVQALSQTQFDALPQRPADGTFVVGGATGRAYRIVAGVASHVPSWAPYGGPQPTITVDQAALDNAGTGGVWDRLTSGPPAAWVQRQDRGTIAGRTLFEWRPGITSSATTSFDLRWRRAPWNERYSRWQRPGSYQRTGLTNVPLGLRRGHTYCVSVRGRNAAGMRTGWSRPRCTARSLDDRRLDADARWKERRGARYDAGTYVQTDQKGARLSIAGARVRRVGVVATACPGCGTVVVRVDGIRVGKVDLDAPATRRRQVFMVGPFPRERGAVTVTVKTRNSPVKIDGLVLSRS